MIVVITPKKPQPEPRGRVSHAANKGEMQEAGRYMSIRGLLSSREFEAYDVEEVSHSAIRKYSAKSRLEYAKSLEFDLNL